LSILAQLSTPRTRLFYWRTTTGNEVDFVLEKGRKLMAIEAKLAKNPRYGDADNLRIFLDDYPETQAGILVHGGSEIRYLDEKIVAVPWTRFAL
jgi:predicted AAA+ superfamily ATPase